MTRDQRRDKFLVESVGGCWHELDSAIIPTVTGTTCIKCGEVFGDLENPNPDFNRPENFIRLLGIAEKKHLYVDIQCSVKLVSIYDFEIMQEQSEFKEKSDVLRITADLIAKALGFVEGEKE